MDLLSKLALEVEELYLKVQGASVKLEKADLLSAYRKAYLAYKRHQDFLTDQDHLILARAVRRAA